jgi:DNA sulfur modification protein DndE
VEHPVPLRWAFCLSLRQPSPPTPVEIPADSNVEMSWQVFGSEKERCERDGLRTSDDVLGRQLHRRPRPPGGVL